MSDFDHYLERILVAAADEARAEGATAVEARHLLLAIAADPRAGLDRDALRQAFDREFAASLAAAGVHLTGGLPRATRARDTSPGMDASAKAAIERAFTLAGRKRDLRPEHLLLGVVLAGHGTVPRALALAGIDRDGLADRVRRQLP